MGSSISTTTQRFCDFCKEPADDSKLRRLRTERIGTKPMRTVSADICANCRDHTIAELLALLDEKLAAKAKT